MKKILFVLVTLGFYVVGYAQKTLPEIKAGTVLNTSIFVSGQEYPAKLTVKSITAPIVLAWAVENYGEGS